MRARIRLAAPLAAAMMTWLCTAPAYADGSGIGTYVPENAPRDYEPGISANDFYGLLDSALHKNFESLIMVFGGCFAGDFAAKLPNSEVGQAGHPAACMTATGEEKDQLYEQTPGTLIGNPFIEGVNDGWSGIDEKTSQATEGTEEEAFNSGAARVEKAIKDWNVPTAEETKRKLLKETHPDNKYINGGNKLTLKQKENAKRYAIIFVGEPETVQDWRDYSNVFLTLNDAGYQIQGFFGSGKRSPTDHTALLPNGHSVLEDTGPEVKTDPKTGAHYGGHLGNIVTNYVTTVHHRENGKSFTREEEVTIPFGAATTDDLVSAMANWRDASGKSCAVFYFTAFGHFLPVVKDRAVPLKVGGATAPDCKHVSYHTGGSGGGSGTGINQFIGNGSIGLGLGIGLGRGEQRTGDHRDDDRRDGDHRNATPKTDTTSPHDGDHRNTTPTTTDTPSPND
jgi:hypothetical protein